VSLRDRILAILFAAFLVVLVARAARKEGGVLVTNQGFGARFLAGDDPYFDPALGRRIHSPYPPSLALVAAPLALLPTPAARVAWALAQACALVAAFVLLRRWARRWWPDVAPQAPLLFACALLLASRFVLRDAAGGGGNLVYMVLALAGLELAFSGRELAAGAPLALSLVLKPNLAPLLLFFAATRRWKAIASTVACAAVLFLLPALSFGFGRYLDLAERWVGDVWSYAQQDESTPASDTTMNQSLAAAAQRLLEPSAARVAALALALALVAWAAVVAARARPGRPAAIAALAFLPLALLVSPITWKAHHAALLPLFFVLCAVAWAKRRWSPLATFLAVYWIACDLASEEVVGRALRDRLQALSIVTWGDVALLAVALVLVATPDVDPHATR